MMQITAVVDANADSIIVWHVDLSTVSPVLSRMCGAWVLTDEPHKLELLTRDRLVVPTPAGAKLLAATSDHAALVDLDSTLNQVVVERNRLQGLYDVLPPSRKKTLVAPRWPQLPTPINIDYPPRAETADPTVAVALGIARYLEQLVIAWIAIEGQRTARTYFNEGSPGQPPAIRELPIIRQ